jgi:hypothetical protein
MTFRLTISLIVCLLFLAGCGASASQASLNYVVTPCNESGTQAEAKLEITAQEGAIQISQMASYVCCAQITLRLEQTENLLKIIETNEGEVCRCMCSYPISAQINGLPAGSYRVQVWGIQYQDVHPLERLGEATLEIK